MAKKYKRAKKVVNWGAGGSNFLSAAFSSASLRSALSVVGLPPTIPLGGVGNCYKKRHQEIVTVAIAKHETVDWLFSKAMVDNQVSDTEFQLIMTEFSQCNVPKEVVTAKLTCQPSRKNVADVEKVKKDICSKVEEVFRQKLNTLT